MTSVEQSTVYPDVYYIRVNDTTITTDEKTVRELLRSGMSTVTGKAMLEDYVNRITKK